MLTDEAHRAAFDAVLRSHSRPEIMAQSLLGLNQGMNGPAYDWPTIGAALLELQANGEPFNVSRLRGYCRNVGRAAAEPALPAPNGRRKGAQSYEDRMAVLRAFAAQDDPGGLDGQ